MSLTKSIVYNELNDCVSITVLTVSYQPSGFYTQYTNPTRVVKEPRGLV